ncbi:MAG TPA: LuxR C-terminal-related transcriptional regulator [Nocardioidaceae bacterium]|nr:LuxR C-terminal-related transcriptional regulator [Nocardioidaceae bacterium]
MNVDSPLAALGFTADAQRLYALVLDSPRSQIDHLAWLSGLPPARVEAALAPLRKEGLVTLDEGRVIPLPPEDSINRILVTRSAELRAARDELEDVRRVLPGFAAQHRAATALGDESVTVEVIRGRDLIPSLRILAASAPGEMLWMRPDQWKYDDGRRADDVIKEFLEEGRRSRVIYPARALEEAPALVRARAELGEQVRVLATVPTRLAILGTTLALLPMRLGSDAERVLLLRQESVVGALRLFFESMWDQALPIPGFEATAEQALLGERRLLLEQLSSGAKDEQIARALGLSLRTVRRRVADLMEALGAESRFALGAEAVRRGWL